jgi:curli biogenesis system outer membrane secretion channel CsgG
LRRSPSRAARAALLAGAAVVLAAGCASTPHYTNRRADVSSMRKVAVLPFDNISEERLAGEKVQRIFIAELLEAGAFDVVEPGRVIRVLRDEKIESPTTMSPEDVQRVGKALGADGLVLGSVLELSEPRGSQGAPPSVTVQLKLVETATGTTVWSATRQRTGATFGSRFLGLTPASSTEVVSAALRDAIHTIGR